MHNALEIFRGTQSRAVVDAILAVDTHLAEITRQEPGSVDYDTRQIVRLPVALNQSERTSMQYQMEAAGWVAIVFGPNTVSFLFPTTWRHTC
ncbi:hypothetical protein ST201phi2-1p018 [Pseudomonas phage 201phi2-1]|uniref:Uncharacterized protein n=1 Tax=Pseudomonas phage 201phi2-1 TaxID=198110 RepID=B3FJZ4_BP201|nr:hypothetical protein ST201phi2-1p018 [Pseudomonas phage 201phi2-1]ABY62852.1 hypothetical protein 201phi2-1p018 [Pseudomonas phage 201phi2-1]